MKNAIQVRGVEGFKVKKPSTEVVEKSETENEEDYAF